MLLPRLGITLPNMGTKSNARMGLAQALFSQVQLRVLSLLFCHPNRAYRSSEIIRLAHSGSGAVQRELHKLTKAGLVTQSSVDKQKLYQANRQSPIYREIRGLMLKTVGLLEPLRAALKPFASDIRVAFVYGSIAKGSDTAQSDVDLMIVAESLSYSEVYAALQKAERLISRPVNPNLMTNREWRHKLAEHSSFLTKIVRQPKLFVFGSENELEELGQPS